MNKEDKAKLIVNDILSDLKGRQGFDVIDDIDDDIMDDMLECLKQIVIHHLGREDVQ